MKRLFAKAIVTSALLGGMLVHAVDTIKVGVLHSLSETMAISEITVKENLEIGVMTNRSKIKKITDKIYDLFPVLKDMANRKGGDLSGGQQQQLAIGRALCIDPNFLILDEPSEGIQLNIVAQMGQVIDYLTKEEQITVLLVEQELPFARRHGDDFYVIDRGSVVANGEIGQLSDEIIRKYMSVWDLMNVSNLLIIRLSSI